MTTLLTMTTHVTLKHCTSRNLNWAILALPPPPPTHLNPLLVILNLEATISTNNFSRLMSIHSLKTLIERIYLKIKAFFLILSTLHFSIHKFSYPVSLSLRLLGKKWMLIILRTQRVIRSDTPCACQLTK